MKKLYTLFFAICFAAISNLCAQTEFRLDSTHVYSWYIDDWSHNTRELYTYENGGTKETNLLRLIGNASGWVNYYQRNKIYNAANNITENIQQNWESGAWVDKLRESYTYDDLDNQTSYVSAILVGGTWGSTKREVKTYESGRLVSKTVESAYVGATLVPTTRYLYDYDPLTNELSEEIEQTYFADVDVWQNVRKMKYSYTTFGALHTVEDIGFNSRNGEFNNFPTLQTLFNYNALQQLTDQVVQLRINDGYRNNSRFVYVYTFGNQTELIIQEWHNLSESWQNKSRQLRTFNTDNNETSLIYQSWDADTETWKGFVRTDSFWSIAEDFDITLSNTEPIEKEFGISMYPNPATNFININSQEEVKSITLYNLHGQQILVDKNNTRLDVSHLAAGLYVAKIDLGNSIKTKKILIKN
ncbi:T9SS type A sorting domain-containing protein [Algibacter sp. L4_22]|uniref:T9SS type A sorting domain-containing protein n=1 Tax=Algibacter sp. L4_22 TaxID=2942477 RepID=UPI00201B6EA6|nr:T9SS type A sorting domain-containing protein [Algibacter sp. L4_22]MCL5128128.1 T9SS type A sorting domain-containing protein [Algibacter sp. L4_22]